jgi:hypothetical protein
MNQKTSSRRFLRRSKSIDGAQKQEMERSSPKPPSVKEELASQREPKSDSEKPPTDTLKPGEHFERVIKAMRDVQLSTSPGVQHGPPNLLLRLQEQEKGQKQAGQPSGSDVRRIRPPTAEDVDTLTSRFATQGGESREFESPRTHAETQSSRMTTDARCGLASLMTRNNTITGLIRHQSIQFLREIASLVSKPGSAPCDWAQWIIVPYYSHREDVDKYDDIGNYQDATLEEYIVWLMYHCICETPGCGESGSNHARAFIHNKTKISCSIVKTGDDGQVDPPSIQGELVHWCECKLCKKVSPVSILFYWTVCF